MNGQRVGRFPLLLCLGVRLSVLLLGLRGTRSSSSSLLLFWPHRSLVGLAVDGVRCTSSRSLLGGAT